MYTYFAEANFFVLGVLVHQFTCFFFNWLKMSRRFHFFVLEHSQMKSDRRTTRTTVRTPPCMNTEGTLVTKKKQEIIPV